MIKLKKKITNPMTIIAIFATLSETSAAISLPFLDNEEREIYVWFLISFPFYLLFLFFATLNFNYRSLYSPSDFEKDEHFLKAMDDVEPAKESSCDARRAQAPPEAIDCLANPSDAHHIRLPELLKDMHVIDARRMKNKMMLSAMLEQIKKTREGQAKVILFLTGSKLEKSLSSRVLKFSRQARKRGSASYCVAYDLSSQRVTVMDQSCQLTPTEQ